MLIVGTIITTTVSVYGQGPPSKSPFVTQEQLQQALANVVTDEELQQVLNKLEECPAGTIYEGFFVNGDGDLDTTIPEDEVLTEICIPTAQLNVIKTMTCDVEEFGQEFCDSIREPKISVLGNNPIPSFFFGTESPGTPVSLGPGAYHVDEVGFTEGLEPCKTEGFDGGRNLGDGIFICTNFSDECQGAITIGSLQTCTIDNNVLEQNFLDLAVANYGTPGGISILLGTGTGSFGTKPGFEAGSSIRSITVGDFNGDEELDLAVTNYFTDGVSILLGTGNGSFGTATSFSVGDGPWSIIAGDFNNDGKLDLVTANENSDNVSILLGTGTGSFGTVTNFETGDQPRSVAVGDFNNDGKLDLAVANHGVPSGISILLGTGTGSFNTATSFGIGSGSGPFSVAVGDFNNDGKLDLVTANENSDNVSILLGTGTGSFGTATSFETGDGPVSIAVGDFNGDAELDLVTANYYSDNVSILIGTGTGSFGTATSFEAGDGPFSVAVGDFNGDAESDLAVANFHSNDVFILLGNGDGTFDSANNFAAGDGPVYIAVGDFTSTTPIPNVQLQQQQRTNDIITTTNNNNDDTIIKNISQKREEQKQIEEQKIQKNNIMSPPSLPKNTISIPIS